METGQLSFINEKLKEENNGESISWNMSGIRTQESIV